MHTKKFNWNFFLPKQKLSADGSTTGDALRTEKKRLEARLVEIPVLVSQLSNQISLRQADITWLNSLNNRRKKDWAKENQKSVEQAVYDASNSIVNNTAQVDALTVEKGRIPSQITAIDRQLESLVKGESAGLSKGLTTAHAQQLGELELRKEQDKITQETKLQEIEVQKAQAEVQVAIDKNKAMSPTLKWSLIISGALIALVLLIYFIRKHKKAQLPKPIAV